MEVCIPIECPKCKINQSHFLDIKNIEDPVYTAHHCIFCDTVGVLDVIFDYRFDYSISEKRKRFYRTHGVYVP